MNKALATTLLMTTLALAGCLQDGTSKDPDTGGMGPMSPDERLTLPEDPMPEADGHDHGAPSQHRFLWNYAFSERDPMQSNLVTAAGLHALDLQAGHLFGAVYGGQAASANGGLQIWDLADPSHPEPRGFLPIPGTVGGDRSIGATPDGDFVVVGAEQLDCFGHVNPVPVAAYLIDATNKDLPVIADTITSVGPSIGSPHRVAPSLGEHSIFVQRIGDVDYAFVFGKVFEIDRDGPTATLVDTGYAINTGHDIYLRETPWGSIWALTANGGNGFQVFDVTDVSDIRLIANWDLEDRDAGPDYYFHTADVAFFDDGQIVMILSSEDWGDHISPYWIFDATPLRDHSPDGEAVVLDLIGMWANPGGHNAGGISFSLHNPRFHENGLMTLSSYHGGLWQFDFRHPDFRGDPNVIAYAVYAEGDPPMVEDPVADIVESTLCGLGINIDTPTYMDVEMDEATGTLYAADVYMGLYTFTPTADHIVYGDAGPRA